MKIRKGFVSNSSSTSFVITNITDTSKTIKDFAIENKKLIDDFNEEYGDGNYHYTLEDVLKCAKVHIKFNPKQSKTLSFGDEEGTPIGTIYDYMLREGGKSKSFKWKFYKFLR